MRIYPPVNLFNFKPNQKFIWNNIVYSVYQSEGGMTEVYAKGRFWAWNSNTKVKPVIMD